MNKFIYSWQCVIDLVETGKNIRRYRLMRGLSVQNVSDFFGGIARNSIYKWERGETLPCMDNLYALAWLLRVSLDELIVGNRESLDPDDDQLVDFLSQFSLKAGKTCKNRMFSLLFVVTYQVADKHLWIDVYCVL